MPFTCAPTTLNGVCIASDTIQFICRAAINRLFCLVEIIRIGCMNVMEENVFGDTGRLKSFFSKKS